MEKELRLGTNTKIPLDGGLNYNEETSIPLNNSPYMGMLNMCINNGRVLSKREGQTYMFTNDVGTSPVNAIYNDFKGKAILHIGTSLYNYDGSNAPTLIGNGLANTRSCIFVYNGILYILDGTSYKQYDGTTLKDVEPYVPRVVMNSKADGSTSSIDESFNMLGSGFMNSFNGDGTSKDYKLSLSGLDSTPVTIKVNGVAMTEDSGFTVDRVNGTVTFTNAPTTGTNNVEIIAYKTFANLKSNILNCKYAIEFSNRIFISGNSNICNTYFASGLTSTIQANYFPQKYMYTIRGVDKAITGFKVHYNKLIVFKEDMTCTVTASTGLDNTASFPIEFLNTEIGCDVPYSIQLIDNNIVFANSYGGVFIIASTQIPGEKSIICLSKNINGDSERLGLLSEYNIKNACSVDFDFKYYLALGDKAYVLDYKNGISITDTSKNKWFLYDNIKSNCFGVLNGSLIYGHNEKGNLVKFINAKTDFGLPINAYWKSSLMDFGYSEYLKMVSNMWVTFNVLGSGQVITINYMNEKGYTEKTIDILGKKTFSWSNFSWSNFSWYVNLFDSVIKAKVRLKKIVYFQLEFRNNVLGEDLSIKNIVLNYRLIRKVR